MKISAIVAVFSLATLCAAQFTPPHPCFAYPTKLPKLHLCSTASSFCSSYLGGTGSFTRTVTKTTRVAQPPDTVTSTSTSLTTTTISTTTTTTVLDGPTTTITLTTIDPNCGALDKRTRAETSCGINSEADPSEVSGACNCILVSKTTSYLTESETSTSTTVITTTSTTTTTTTSDSTIAAPTSTFTVTETACATACPNTNFFLLASDSGTGADGSYAVIPDGGDGDLVTTFQSIGSATQFYINSVTSWLEHLGSDGAELANINTGSSLELLYFNLEDEFPSSQYTPAICNVDTGILLCNDSGDTEFSLFDGSFLYIGTVGTAAENNNAVVTLTPVCA